jgi:hypothetical protein
MTRTSDDSVPDCGGEVQPGWPDDAEKAKSAELPACLGPCKNEATFRCERETNARNLGKPVRISRAKSSRQKLLAIQVSSG